MGAHLSGCVFDTQYFVTLRVRSSLKRFRTDSLPNLTIIPPNRRAGGERDCGAMEGCEIAFCYRLWAKKKGRRGALDGGIVGLMDKF